MNKALPVIAESVESLQTQLRAETDPKKRTRVQALYLLASGQALSRLALAQLLAVHRHTIQAWLKLYEEGGLRALLAIKKAPGNPPSVSPGILTKLQEQLSDVRGFGSYGEVQQYLARTHQVALAYSPVHKLVRSKLKAKLKAPPRSHPKKSPKT
jgi:putative transposase